MGVVVVGGGAAGCAAAYTLRKLGHEVDVLEAQDHIGGRTFTFRRDGFALDTGAVYLTSAYDRTLALTRELERTGSLVRWRFQVGLRDGDCLYTVRFDEPSSYLKLPLLDWRDKLRLSMRALRHAVRPAPGLFDPDSLAIFDSGEAIDTWARRELGEAAYQYVVRPGIEAAYGVGCEEVSVALELALLKHHRKTRFLCLAEGIGTICEWLASGARIHTRTPVEAIELRDERVRVRAAGDLVSADAVVVATEAPIASGLLGDTLSPELVAGLRDAPYAANIHVAVGYEEDPFPGFPTDVVIPVGPCERAIGSIGLHARKSSSLVPAGGQVVDVYFYDRPSREMTEIEARRRAREAIAEILGKAPEPLFEEIFVRRWGLAIPRPGHYAAIGTVRDAMPPRIRLAGDYLTHASIEAAVRSGERAGEEVHTALS